MGATLSVWNGQYKMIPVYLSVEIQNSKYKIQNDTNLTLCDSTKYKIKNHTNYHQFGNFSRRNFSSALIWEEFRFTIPEGNFWLVSMMIDMKGGRTDSWVWFQILFMDGDKVGGGTNFRDWQISGQVRFFNWHLFNFDHTHSIDNSFSKFSQKYFSFPVHQREGRDERMVERCYLVLKWYLRWYLVIATASAAISLMTSNSFQL